MSTIEYPGKAAIEQMRATADKNAADGQALLNMAADPTHPRRKTEYQTFGKSLIELAETLRRWADEDETTALAQARGQ